MFTATRVVNLAFCRYNSDWIVEIQWSKFETTQIFFFFIYINNVYMYFKYNILDAIGIFYVICICIFRYFVDAYF